ncbi:MAG: response regulator [Candidatus Omnitrophota bacterium]
MEKDLDAREGLYDLLSLRGYKVFTAPDREDAYSVIRNDKLDLVLLGVDVCEGKNFDILNKIKSFDPKVQIIVLTSCEDSESERLARQNGASGYLRKNLGFPLISRVIHEILSGEPTGATEDKKKVLIVDDYAEICELLKDFLSRKGYSPITANSGEEALEKVMTEKPLIVLLDINMPGMDGLMTLKKIKEIDPRIAVIMITGLEDETLAEEAVRLGAYDYIRKPLNLSYLEMCLLTKVVLSSV